MKLHMSSIHLYRPATRSSRLASKPALILDREIVCAGCRLEIVGERRQEVLFSMYRKFEHFILALREKPSSDKEVDAGFPRTGKALARCLYALPNSMRLR